MSHEDDLRWMRQAIDLSRKCPPSNTAFSVGAIIVDAAGEAIATGYSRETDAHVHAEESALSKLAPDDPRLATATIYSTLEPCTERKSRPVPCTDLILRAGIPRVVIAWREPDLFVSNCSGAETLRSSGVDLCELSELAEESAIVNSHLSK
jgi:diaminohydroxyphosphoribosylaminopyrimidine deaminase/5-amino-6-(5-phosphoribosylamino)uracil reductase